MLHLHTVPLGWEEHTACIAGMAGLRKSHVYGYGSKSWGLRAKWDEWESTSWIKNDAVLLKNLFRKIWISEIWNQMLQCFAQGWSIRQRKYYICVTNWLLSSCFTLILLHVLLFINWCWFVLFVYCIDKFVYIPLTISTLILSYFRTRMFFTISTVMRHRYCHIPFSSFLCSFILITF